MGEPGNGDANSNGNDSADADSNGNGNDSDNGTGGNSYGNILYCNCDGYIDHMILFVFGWRP